MKVIYLLESYAIYTKEIENMARKDFFLNPLFQICFANSINLSDKYIQNVKHYVNLNYLRIIVSTTCFKHNRQ